MAAPRSQFNSSESGGDAALLADYNRIDHKRRTSLRRKMQHLKHRNDSIHETEDEEEDFDNLFSGSESEGIYERNANLLMNQVKDTQTFDDEGNVQSGSNKLVSSKKLKDRVRDQGGVISVRSTKRIRPKSSKSLQGRKKRTSPSSKPFHRSLEHLPNDINEIADNCVQNLDEFVNKNYKRKAHVSRPRSAPRKNVSHLKYFYKCM